ncbi:serine/threonine-protein kinase [Streptomyces alanosinicus]|uniref:Serine/threonine protein kinase n=1 Tax=Streptomyces alanosinicus TaxID=68171 RepID=A0A918YKC4_9ACTN|nr:serine/threonine-protein kinase [Streptomyces alanosinicus]GHE06994.1 serine/threonine protein kinase [Streptomyces alanosinicus]
MTPRRNTGAGAEAELPEYAGHYRLQARLGSGGMGVVHLARSTSGMKLAVKVVHAEFARDPEFRGRFRQEVAAARKVSGAFTAPVVDADPNAERPWMATLFIPGPTLSDEVKRNGAMAPAQLRRLMAGLAEALRDIHRVGVVHRDLKPSNVLLAEDGPKVIDFGISRPKDSELRTETGKLIGTPPFMAPEQFRRPREVGPAADLFALGSVMVHAATGRGPFDSDSPYVVAYQVVHDEPDLTGVPEDIAPLVLRCLAKEPEDRPTPDELMRELRTTAASYDTQAFIPAQRSSGEPAQRSGNEPAQQSGNEPTGDEPAERAGDERAEPAGGGPASESGAERPKSQVRRRVGRKVAISAGAFGLVVAAALACVQLVGKDGPAPAGTAPHTKAAVFSSWAARPAPTGAGMPQCSYGAGRLLCTRPGAVYALSLSGGKLLWRHSVAAEPVSGPPVLSGSVVQLSTDGSTVLEAFDLYSGKERWKRPLPDGTAVHYAGRTPLLTGAGGTITAVDPGSGRTKWSRPLPGSATPSLASFPGDPLAYATTASRDGTRTLVTAVDPESGAVRWTASLKGVLKPVGNQGTSLVLLSVDRATGETDAVVRYTPASKTSRRVVLPVPQLTPQAGTHGDMVYLLATGGSLEAVDLNAGKLLWHIETSVSRGSAPVGDGEHVYFTAADGRLLAMDARDGRLVGQTRPRLGTDADKVTADLPAPVVVDGHVYASAPDGTVFGVAAHDPAGW